MEFWQIDICFFILIFVVIATMIRFSFTILKKISVINEKIDVNNESLSVNILQIAAFTEETNKGLGEFVKEQITTNNEIKSEIHKIIYKTGQDLEKDTRKILRSVLKHLPDNRLGKIISEYLGQKMTIMVDEMKGILLTGEEDFAYITIEELRLSIARVRNELTLLVRSISVRDFHFFKFYILQDNERTRETMAYLKMIEEKRILGRKGSMERYRIATYKFIKDQLKNPARDYLKFLSEHHYTENDEQRAVKNNEEIELLLTGKLHEVFRLLNLKVDKKSEAFQSMIVLQASYNELEAQKIKNIISHEEARIHHSKIVWGLVQNVIEKI